MDHARYHDDQICVPAPGSSELAPATQIRRLGERLTLWRSREPRRLRSTRCEICHCTVAYRPGGISEVLTEHCRRAYPMRSAYLPSRLRELPALSRSTFIGVDYPDNFAGAGRGIVSGHGVWPPLVRVRT
jgi:hypothetical protein